MASVLDPKSDRSKTFTVKVLDAGFEGFAFFTHAGPFIVFFLLYGEKTSGRI